ncbi:hypothetical protein [Trichocoleus sp. FACHB-46]|nr:hypothetical protein [Trichocoleus sp. FACHB-46]
MFIGKPKLAFLTAAGVIWQLAQRQPKVPPGIWILITLATSTEIGSSLFHTLATQ